jgi:hypothetical protein
MILIGTNFKPYLRHTHYRSIKMFQGHCCDVSQSGSRAVTHAESVGDIPHNLLLLKSSDCNAVNETIESGSAMILLLDALSVWSCRKLPMV